MNIESTELKKDIEEMKEKIDDEIGQAFNRGLNTAIRLIEIIEEREGLSIAKERGE